MAINYATTYGKKAVDAFKLASITRGVLSDEFKFVADSGKSVKLFTVATAAMNDYQRTGTARYGTPEELQNTVQELTCTRERSFAFTIDALNAMDTGNVHAAAAALRKQIDEVITPEIDQYTLGKLAAGVTSNKVTGATTKDNAYEQFLELAAMLDEAKAPRANRVAWINSAFYKFIKQDPAFMKASDMAQQMLVNGQVGEIDGVKLIVAPSSYMPEGVNVIMAHKDAAIQPVRLESYTTHENPPGINGTLCEGLVYYDAFILDARKDAVAVVATA